MATLEQLRAEVDREWRATRRPAPSPASVAPPRSGLGRAVLVAVLRVAVILLLPFVVLVRSSVFLYARRGAPTWLALACGALLALFVVTVYAAWLSHRLSGRARVGVMAKWVAGPLVVAYCGYALLYLSALHAKSPVVQAEYRAVHPLLRIAVATLTLADRGLVITDLERVPADYPAMGLPVYDGSLHYVQADGWAHAMDLRTSGRSMIANGMRQLYFAAMGFGTLRHVGTADHLHVELALPRR
jgi:hypothetical protein